LAKAFDCVHHKIPLGKLIYYGIHGVNIQFFESYLAGGKQNVDIISQNHQQKFSLNWGTIKCGAPQGSLLGTLLIIIYINDLPLGIHTDSRPMLFADNTSILITTNNLN
jgi:Reverse transcriptase (RNA-dependent DNA polymerase).